MPAARYWRIVGIETYAGGDLELSELHLYGASGRVDAAATLTSTIAPTAGTLAALQDDDLATTCRFAGAAVRAGGFALVWDFGPGAQIDVRFIRIGAVDFERFLSGAALQSSSDGLVWVTYASARGVVWSGAGEMTQPPAANAPPMDGNDALFMRFEGVNSSTDLVDDRGHVFTANNGAQLTTLDPLDGASSLNLSTGGWAITPPSPDFDLGTGAFTIRMTIRPAVVGGASLIGRTHANLYGVQREWDLQMRNATTLIFYHGIRGASQSIHVFNLPITMTVGGTYDVLMGRDDQGRFRLFINGSLAVNTRENAATEVDTTDLSNPGNNLPLLLGTFYYYGNNYSGLMDSVRLRKGENPPLGADDFKKIADVSGYRALTTAVSAGIAASAPVPAHSTPLAARLQLARDVEHGGLGIIYGTTKTKGTPNQPAKARVVLLHQRSKLPVRETWSDPATGAFAFTGIDTTQQFLTLAEDAAGNYRPVAANRLTPEVLP